MKINLGAGDTRFDGFVNCDYDARTGAEHIFDMEKDKFPFEDNTVEQVIAHHVFEHMGEGYFHCLQEVYRVCKHGALIDIRVPHPRHDYYLNDPTHRRPITPDGLALFSRKYNDACIEQNAAASRLGYYFKVDFEVVDVNEIPDPMYMKAFEGMQMEQAKRYIHEHNNIVMEYHIRMVAIKND
jgi:ubiquinone/menaquinone biosynthesis C-methylase UbiE